MSIIQLNWMYLVHWRTSYLALSSCCCCFFLCEHMCVHRFLWFGIKRTDFWYIYNKTFLIVLFHVNKHIERVLALNVCLLCLTCHLCAVQFTEHVCGTGIYETSATLIVWTRFFTHLKRNATHSVLCFHKVFVYSLYSGFWFCGHNFEMNIHRFVV